MVLAYGPLISELEIAVCHQVKGETQRDLQHTQGIQRLQPCRMAHGLELRHGSHLLRISRHYEGAKRMGAMGGREESLGASLQRGRMHVAAANIPVLFTVDADLKTLYWVDPVSGDS